MPKKDFAIINWVTLAVCLIVLVLNLYLLMFHMDLIKRNTTTYKHIRQKQRRAKSRVIKKIDEGENSNQ